MFIGKKPIAGNFQMCDAISVVNGQAAYTMQVGGVNVAPETALNTIVSLNGTIQKANSSYTIANSVITFSSNLATGDVIDFILILGDVLSIGHPSDDTVSTAKIVDDAVTAAKINNDIISGSTELASEPADTDEFLVSDAGTLKRIDYSLIKGGGITVADQWRLTADSSISSSSLATIASNLERVDTATQGFIGTAMSESSGIFTFPSTGVYLVMMNMVFKKAGSSQWLQTQIQVSSNSGGAYNIVSDQETSISQVASATTSTSATMNSLVDVTDASTFRVRFQVAVAATTSIEGNTDKNYTYFTFIRLGDT